MKTHDEAMVSMKEWDESFEPTMSFHALAEDDTGNGVRKQLVEIQLKMATCSINHEYARLEFDESGDPEQREHLLEYMEDCRSKYFEAREVLAAYDISTLEEFEADLMRQKQTTLVSFHA